MSDVSVTLSKTLQDGNYEPIRIEIGVTDSVRADEKVSDAVDRVYNLVERKLLSKVESELKEMGRK